VVSIFHSGYIKITFPILADKVIFFFTSYYSNYNLDYTFLKAKKKVPNPNKIIGAGGTLKEIHGLWALE